MFQSKGWNKHIWNHQLELMLDEKKKSGTNGNQMQRVEIVNCPTTEMIHLIQLVQGFLGKDIILLTMFSTIKSSKNQI